MPSRIGRSRASTKVAAARPRDQPVAPRIGFAAITVFASSAVRPILGALIPSAEKRRFFPWFTVAFIPETRAWRCYTHGRPRSPCLAVPSETANNNTATPGLPSGVSPADIRARFRLAAHSRHRVANPSLHALLIGPLRSSAVITMRAHDAEVLGKRARSPHRY